MGKASEQHQLFLRFFAELERQYLENRRAMAILRRAITPDPHPEANSLIRRAQANIPGWDLADYRLVSALWAMQPGRVTTPPKYGYPDFGWSCAILDRSKYSQGVTTRLKALLSVDRLEIPPLLENLVRQIQAKQQPIDYPRLLSDILAWDHPDRYVQDRWAVSYWNLEEEASVVKI